MDTELLIALIVGSAGVALALLALIMAVLARLSSSHAAEDVQRLRQELAQAQSASWMKDQELESKLKARKVMLDGLQRVKDEIDRLLHPGDDGHTAEEINQSISDAGRIFSKLVEDHAEKLGEAERRAAGYARDAAVELAFETRRMLDAAGTLAELGSRDKETVVRLRAQLTEAQLMLRDRMMDRLVKRALSDLHSD